MARSRHLTPAALALLILALITAGILFLMTGSLVLPLVAVAMNVLTVAVGAGLLVLAPRPPRRLPARVGLREGRSLGGLPA